MSTKTRQVHWVRHATAVAATMVAAGWPGLALTAVTPGGATNAWPGNATIGPGDTDLGNVGLWVGNGAPGTLNVDDGSLLRTGALYIGPSADGNGDGIATLHGAGTRVLLVGDGFSQGVVNRFGVGEWGRGSLTVSGGALLDGRADANACLGANHYCNNFIGNAAGSDGTFTVTGPGSQAQFLRFFGVGGLAVFRPPVDGFTFGTPGGTTRGRVNVLDGGLLVTDNAILGFGPGGGSPQGDERSFADAVIRGSGSVWRVTGGTLEPSQGAGFDTATHRNAWATLNIADGGMLKIEGDGQRYISVNLTSGGGRTDASLIGAGSRLTFAGGAGMLRIGESLGTASLDIAAGAQADSMFYLSVGRNGSFGTLVVDGIGSMVRVDGTASAAANGNSGTAFVDIGRNGGNGVATVRNGGRIEVLANITSTNGTGMNLGRDANSAGTLNIDSGGVVLFRTDSVAPDSADEAWNPGLRVGRVGSGTLNVTGGGQLLVEGNAVSTPTHTRDTTLFIGGAGRTTVGGKGVATVSGAGSALRVTGSDAYIGVGHGPQAVGNLTVSAGAEVVTTIMGVGNHGGTGVARLDGGTLMLQGQNTGAGEYAAALVIGAGAGGVGNLMALNGSSIRVENAAGNGGGVVLGGTSVAAGGDGSLSLSGASLILDVPTNNGYMIVGNSGSGLLRLQNASVVDLGGNSLVVARSGGSDGTLIATGGSSISAGWVGVGRDKTDTGDVDGGTGTMVLNGATLTADKVVIGTNGYLGGSAGSISAGMVVNHGIYSPGNSPGTFTMDASFVAGAGSRLILEVADNPAGGYLTDMVLFTAGHSVDLGSSGIEFRFLGSADPNGFQSSGGFQIDTFLGQLDASGQMQGLGSEAFSQVGFSARADAYTFESFSFTAEGGAVFTAVPVPEPATWLMWLAGVAAMARKWRRSAAA